MHEGDYLVIALEAGRFALPTATVAGVVEVAELPFLPGRSGFVTGMISFRNEPVTVIELAGALGDFSARPVAAHKVIVLREKGRALGVDIGDSEISFHWNTETGKVTGERGLFTSGRIYDSENAIDIIDWTALFNETTRILSADDGKKSPHSR